MSLKKLSGILKFTLIAALLGGFLSLGTGCESNKCHKEGCAEKKPCCDDNHKEKK